MATLGCAETYDAEIRTWLGYGSTGQPSTNVSSKLVTRLDGISRVTWERRLDDTSEASVVVEKAKLSANCCRSLGKFDPWFHDLVLYRDGLKVWRGPIQTVRDSRDTFTIPARDLTAWWERRGWINPGGAVPTDLTQLAAYLVRGAFTTIAGFPERTRPNLPALLHLVNSGITTASSPVAFGATTSIREAIDELAQYGIDWRAHVERIAITGEATSASVSRATLSPTDFDADIDVIIDAESATNRVIVAYGDDPGQWVAATVVDATRNPPLLESFLKPTGEITQADAQALANAAAARGRPPVYALAMPADTTLSPKTRVGINDLYVGDRYNVSPGADHCITQSLGSFRLANVRVEFTRDAGESVRVSFVPLGSAA